jgi:hypothetical protein
MNKADNNLRVTQIKAKELITEDTKQGYGKKYEKSNN